VLEFDRLHNNAWNPTAVLLLPVAFCPKAAEPRAVFELPVVVEPKA
jgi:hypothetical protein